MSARAAQLPALDLSQRYTVPEAAEYLRISRAQLYLDIKAGRIRVIKSGRRTHVPGSEIAKASTLPESAAA